MGANCVIRFLSWFDLSCLYSRDLMEDDTFVDPQAFSEFVKKIYKQVSVGKHESTDHLLIEIVLTFSDGTVLRICFLSFENSVRSSNSGVDISTRIPNFLHLFCRLKEHGVQYIFLCEAGRDIFDGPVKFDPNTKELITPVLRKWQDVVNEVENETGWKQGGLSMNNWDTKANGEVLSFGIAYFYLNDVHLDVEIISHNVKPTKNFYGSGFLELVVKDIRMLFVHFPLDFKSQKESTFTYMCESILEFHQKFPVDLVVGDLNTIMAGFHRYNFLMAFFGPNFKSVLGPKDPSFFGAPCDNDVPEKEVVDGDPIETRSLKDYVITE